MGQYALMTTRDPASIETTKLTVYQAYEAAYRFVAQYCGREPVEPLILMMVNMEPNGEHYVTDDPAQWEDWQRCVAQTLDGAPLPEPGIPTEKS
jgi:hypothetical protein